MKNSAILTGRCWRPFKGMVGDREDKRCKWDEEKDDFPLPGGLYDAIAAGAGGKFSGMRSRKYIVSGACGICAAFFGMPLVNCI